MGEDAKNANGQHEENEPLSDGYNPELDSSNQSLNMAQQVETAELLPVPPDGGYGWIIVVAAFLSNLIVDGICTAFSEFKKSYQTEFGSSDALTALIGSLLIGVYLLVGPIVGGLMNKYGARFVVIVGAIIAGSAFMVSVFSPNIYVFMLTYGVAGGAGFGMIYLPAIVVVGYYFESKRAIATGIAVAGSGVGTIVMPMLSSFVIKDYGWKTAIIVFAVLCFSCIIFGLLYRPLLPPTVEGKDVEMEPLTKGDNRLVASELIEIPDDPAMRRLKSALSECEDGEKTPSSPAANGATPRPRKNTLTSLTNDGDVRSSKQNLSRVSAKDFAQSLSKLNRGSSLSISGVNTEEFARPLSRQDVLYTGSISNLKEFKEEGSLQQYRESVYSLPRAVAEEAINQSLAGGMNTAGLKGATTGTYTEDSSCKCLPPVLREAASEMIDFELLKNPIMLLLCISNLTGMMGFYIPFMFLKDLAEAQGVDSTSSSYLVPIIGITNTVGRIFFGWFADRGYVSALNINNFSLIFCGILTFLCPLMGGYYGLLVYASVFGFVISAYICLTSIVLADLLGLDKLTNSFGLLVVARGIASLSGSPFAGLVFDLSGSYSFTFYFAGIVIIIAGLFSVAISFLHLCNKDIAQPEHEACGIRDEPDNASGKLSVLTERSEENLTEYQRTIQSLRQQHALLREMEEEKRKKEKARQNGIAEEAAE